MRFCTESSTTKVFYECATINYPTSNNIVTYQDIHHGKRPFPYRPRRDVVYPHGVRWPAGQVSRPVHRCSWPIQLLRICIKFTRMIVVRSISIQRWESTWKHQLSRRNLSVVLTKCWWLKIQYQEFILLSWFPGDKLHGYCMIFVIFRKGLLNTTDLDGTLHLRRAGTSNCLVRERAPLRQGPHAPHGPGWPCSEWAHPHSTSHTSSSWITSVMYSCTITRFANIQW